MAHSRHNERSRLGLNVRDEPYHAGGALNPSPSLYIVPTARADLTSQTRIARIREISKGFLRSGMGPRTVFAVPEGP
eukprot:5489698-Pyramimonas_sp.AAC.1